MSYSIKNKVVIITGGAEGIGYEIADKYLSKEAKVVILVDKNEKKGLEAEKSLNTKYGSGNAAFFKCDVTDQETRNVICDKILKTYSYVDVLVNNAGVFNDKKPKLTIDVNVTALIEWSTKFWHLMRKDKQGKGGTIVNLASIYGYRVDPFLPVYQASKFAVVGFTKSLGHENNFKQTGVRVVAICPSFTKTNMTGHFELYNDAAKGDFEEFLKTQLWQEVDAVGKAAVEVFERAESGTAWVIEGAKPIAEVILSVSP